MPSRNCQFRGAMQQPSIKMAPPPRRCNSMKQEPDKPNKMRVLASALATTALCLVLTFQSVQFTRADAALSEVWTESDGLHVKYSTNHDDMLNSKGTELSLSSDQQHQRHHDSATGGGGESGGEGETAGQVAGGSGAGEGSSSGGGEESAPSSEGGASSSAGPSEEGQDQSGGEGEGGTQNEQGVADSRQTEKSVLPSTAGRSHSSYSSLAPDSSPPKRQPSSSISANYKSQSGYHMVDPDEEPASARKFKASSGSSGATDSSSTFDFPSPSFPEQGDSSNESPSAAIEEQSSGDADGSPQSSSSESRGPHAGGLTGANKFRHPGRLFKEAIRMNSESSPSKRQQQMSSAGDEEDNDESLANEGRPGAKSSSSSAPDSEADEKTSSPRPTSEDEDADEGAAWGAPIGKKRPQTSQEQNMIDYGGAQAGSSESDETNGQLFSSRAQQGEGGPAQMSQRSPVSQFGSLDQDEEGGLRPSSQQQQQQQSQRGGPMFFDHSGRAALLAASSQKGRAQPLIQRHPAPARGATTQQPSNGVDTSKRPHKQPNYFRGQASVSRGPQAAVSMNQQREVADVNSPDSVRDDFISPGHYPGSMPHLTQAASEIASRPKTVEVLGSDGSKAGETASVAVVVPAAAGAQDSHQQQATKSSSREASPTENKNDDKSAAASDTNATPQQVELVAKASQADVAGELKSDSKEVARIAVTPMPELQQESQQIMAPILVSTTTMAPLAATSSDAPEPAKPTNEAQTLSTSSSTTTTTITTKAPSLKRFKFRKYR